MEQVQLERITMGTASDQDMNTLANATCLKNEKSQHALGTPVLGL
jgi:hypothetical protein